MNSNSHSVENNAVELSESFEQLVDYVAEGKISLSALAELMVREGQMLNSKEKEYAAMRRAMRWNMAGTAQYHSCAAKSFHKVQAMFTSAWGGEDLPKEAVGCFAKIAEYERACEAYINEYFERLIAHLDLVYSDTRLAGNILEMKKTLLQAKEQAGEMSPLEKEEAIYGMEQMDEALSKEIEKIDQGTIESAREAFSRSYAEDHPSSFSAIEPHLRAWFARAKGAGVMMEKKFESAGELYRCFTDVHSPAIASTAKEVLSEYQNFLRLGPMPLRTKLMHSVLDKTTAVFDGLNKAGEAMGLTEEETERIFSERVSAFQTLVASFEDDPSDMAEGEQERAEILRNMLYNSTYTQDMIALLKLYQLADPKKFRAQLKAPTEPLFVRAVHLREAQKLVKHIASGAVTASFAKRNTLRKIAELTASLHDQKGVSMWNEIVFFYRDYVKDKDPLSAEAEQTWGELRERYGFSLKILPDALDATEQAETAHICGDARNRLQVKIGKNTQKFEQDIITLMVMYNKFDPSLIKRERAHPTLPWFVMGKALLSGKKELEAQYEQNEYASAIERRDAILQALFQSETAWTPEREEAELLPLVKKYYKEEKRKGEDPEFDARVQAFVKRRKAEG